MLAAALLFKVCSRYTASVAAEALHAQEQITVSPSTRGLLVIWGDQPEAHFVFTAVMEHVYAGPLMSWHHHWWMSS